VTDAVDTIVFLITNNSSFFIILLDNKANIQLRNVISIALNNPPPGKWIIKLEFATGNA